MTKWAGVGLLLLAVGASAEDRLPAIAPDKMTEAQKQAAQIFQETRGVPVFGPFVPLLRSPDLMLAAKNMGDYLRYKNSLPPAINEMVILLSARFWNQQIEWQIHAPAALKAGLPQDIIDAIAAGRRPDSMSADQEMAWTFANEIRHGKEISDPTYQRVQQRFGEQGVIDMAGTIGYYDLLAIVMNSARTAADPTKPMLPQLK